MILSFIKVNLKNYQNIYNFTRNASESINNIYYLLNNTKEELNNLLYQFKENIKNISIPFILEQGELINKNEKNKKNISLFDEMEDYKNETNNLNYLYNNLFKYINEEIQIIFDEINEVKKLYLDLQRNIEDVKEIFISKLEEFNKDEDNIKYHEILIQMKNLFISIKEDIINKKIQFKEKMNSLEIQRGKIDLEELKKDCDEIIENINSKILSINNLINGKRLLNNDKISYLYASNIISDYINKTLKRIIQIITITNVETEEGIEVFMSICEVEETTSLNLLFIMDTSGSMGPYLEQAKKNIINIMNRITYENKGINVSIGFIGYSDIHRNGEAYYTNIDFTQNRTELEKKIHSITLYGGGKDWPEDMAWAFEMALNKSWKYNARAIVLVADSPCHGKKYHNYEDSFPDGIPYRKNIEESLEILAKDNVSLYCIKITEQTDIMFQEFENIYKNYTKCNFLVVDMNNENELSDIVVNAATNTYINQRNKE